MRGTAHPVVSSAARNACDRNGWPPVSASQARGAMSRSATSSRIIGEATTGIGGATKGTGARMTCPIFA